MSQASYEVSYCFKSALKKVQNLPFYIFYLTGFCKWEDKWNLHTFCLFSMHWLGLGKWLFSRLVQSFEPAINFFDRSRAYIQERQLIVLADTWNALEQSLTYSSKAFQSRHTISKVNYYGSRGYHKVNTN